MTPIPTIHYPSPKIRTNKESPSMTAPTLRRTLIPLLTLIIGAAVAILGPRIGGPPVVVGGVALIVIGARLLRPLSPGILKWLDDKGV